MSFLDDEQGKEKPKFTISGMDDNIDFEEDPNPKKRSGAPKLQGGHGDEDIVSEITGMFGVTEDELNMAMEKFTDLLRTNSDPAFLKQMGNHMRITNDPNDPEKHFSLDNIGLQMVLDKFLGGSHIPDMSGIISGGSGIADFLSRIMNALPEEDKEDAQELLDVVKNLISSGASDEEIEEQLGIKGKKSSDDMFDEEDDPITSYDFEIIADNESFGAVKFIRSENLYEEFKDIYGESPYDLASFVSTKGYNLIPAFSTMDTLEYIGNNDKYILFMAKSKDPDIEEFVVGAIKTEDEVFDFIVPEFGNSYNIETGEAIIKSLDTHMYQEKEDKKTGVISLDLINPIDPDRIKGGLDLVLYEEKNPILSVKDFGQVFASPSPSVFNTDYIRVGRIKAFDSKEVKMFKLHCDLDDDKEFFDFYIRLQEEFPTRTLDAIQKYFEHIDFNTNIKVQQSELRAKGHDSVYIDLDIGNLGSWARHWVK